jgi:ABC-type multidrug transport system fused ATPase/permease subunit
MTMPSTAETRAAPASRASIGLLRLYAELWHFAHGERRILAGAFVLLLASQLIKLGVPYLSGRAINTLQLQGLPGLGDAGLWLLLVFGATLGSWVLHGPGRVMERNVALTVRARVSALLLDKLLSLPLSWHEAHHSGATVHRVEQSSRALYDFAQSQFLYLQNAVRLVGPIAALWLIEPAVGIAALIGLGAISFSIVGFDRAMIRLALQENDAERRYAATMLDAIGNITSVFALRQSKGVAAMVRRRLLAVYAPLKKSIIVNEAKWGSVDILSQALSSLLLALFAWMAAKGLGHHGPVPAETVPTPTLKLGNIYMVWEYALQAGGVISAVAAHFQTFARQQADFAAGDAVRDEPDAHFAASVSTMTEQPDWRRLDISGLSFHHARSGSAPTLDNVAFTLQRGKRYALIGGSGSGKSTLLRVLAGLYLPQQISVAWDGGAASSDPFDAARLLRATTTLIPQDAEVFEGTLAENLALCEASSGAPSPTLYPQAIATACADAFVDSSETGLEAAVSERGANWSGGQRQRIALARGVLAAQGTALLLLDEPTAALDPTTEKRVYANLFAAFKDAAIVSSVHRLNLLDRFDEVLILDQGKLLDRGSVDELQARSPEFAALVAAQRQDAA